MFQRCRGKTADDHSLSFSLSDLPNPDFSNNSITVTIPAGRTSFEIHTFFTVNDDNIDENNESFAVVAELLDVSDKIGCFQTEYGDTDCFGLRGAVGIIIADNDRKPYSFLYLMLIGK